MEFERVRRWSSGRITRSSRKRDPDRVDIIVGIAAGLRGMGAQYVSVAGTSGAVRRKRGDMRWVTRLRAWWTRGSVHHDQVVRIRALETERDELRLTVRDRVEERDGREAEVAALTDRVQGLVQSDVESQARITAMTAALREIRTHAGRQYYATDRLTVSAQWVLDKCNSVLGKERGEHDPPSE